MMLTALVLACAMNKLGGQSMPVVPAGADRGFQSTVQQVVDATVAKDWAAATKLAARLPKRDIKLQIDTTGVPESRKDGFTAAINKAVSMWTQSSAGLTVTVAAKGDIKISFADKLPNDETTHLPKGLASFVSDDPAEPRVEGVIALHRINATTTVDDVHVQNEALFLIGQYLGLGQMPPGVSAMGRADTIANNPHSIAPPEREGVKENLALVAYLRKAIEEKRPVQAGKVQTRVNPMSVDFGTVTQGNMAVGVFEVTNLGDGRSGLRVTPDCSCFSIAAKNILDANENARVTFAADTTMFPGPFKKSLYVTTSDPERPLVTVEVKGYVRPAYRFLRDKGRGLVYLEDDNGKTTFYLAVADDVKFNIKRVSVTGVNAAATIEPWTGRMADPELGAPMADRHGYKIDVLVSPGSVTGRMLATLTVETDDKVWHHLFHPFNVQRGIAADPGQLYLGLLEKKPRRYSFYLGRPGRPFNVKDVKVDNEHFKVKSERIAEDNWRVVVEFDGKANSGSLSGTVTVRTDDKGQPEVTVPIAAEVK